MRQKHHYLGAPGHSLIRAIHRVRSLTTKRWDWPVLSVTFMALRMSRVMTSATVQMVALLAGPTYRTSFRGHSHLTFVFLLFVKTKPVVGQDELAAGAA